MSTINLLITVIVAALSSTGVWSFFDHTADRKYRKECKRDEKREAAKEKKIDELIADIKKLSSDLNLTKELSKSQARATLNKWSEKFIELGYIPKCYYVAYKTLGDDYIAAGGNSEVKEKFLYIIENLEVK